ncbi:MAG: arsenic efflux protein [Rhodobacteraceae bacterium]|nr:arsenic efflux protein [Paracoccaceae bacterium]
MNLPNLIIATNQGSLVGQTLGRLQKNPKRVAVSIVIVMLLLWSGDIGDVTRNAIRDAFIQVSSFVGFTLFAFYGAERYFGLNLQKIIAQSNQFEIPFATILGAIPGCGGAILVVTAYASGRASFGALVATLVGTMGDAAFLLIAVKPDAALVVIGTSLIIGMLSGFVVNQFVSLPNHPLPKNNLFVVPRIGKLQSIHLLLCIILLAGLFLGVSDLLQINQTPYWDNFALYLSIVGTIIGLLVWTLSPTTTMTNTHDHPISRVAFETSFITVWIIGGFLAYEYLTHFTPFDITSFFLASFPYLPLIGVIIGFIPGCGPQIVLTTLYINGIVPFAAIMGNAISNDGDALFPAIAIAPKAAFMATIYSAIPALIVAYSFYFLLPSFLN